VRLVVAVLVVVLGLSLMGWALFLAMGYPGLTLLGGGLLTAVGLLVIQVDGSDR
jgi:hypothetical protein